MKCLVLLVLLSFLQAAAMADEVRFYLGTYTEGRTSQGIYTGKLDTGNGRLGPLELAVATTNPNFLALSPNGKFLYASTGSSVAAFRVENDGRLTALNELPAGDGTCHVSVDATGRNVFAANYNGGSVACFQTRTDGSLAVRTAFVQLTGSGPNPERQKHPYLHSIYAADGNRLVYACDLGTDNIWLFKFDAQNGTLTFGDGKAGKVPAGSGPRHLALHPGGRFAYVNGEMGLNVTAFARDPVTGALTALQTLPTLPEGAPSNGVTTAEIFCHPSGKWLYLSNRGHDSITVYAIAGDGRLKWIENAPAGVKVPRGFGIDPTGRWLIAAGQQDNKIALLKIDSATGKLSATDQSAGVGAPICVIFAPRPPATVMK
jgi:6-phosphogluconolactonase